VSLARFKAAFPASDTVALNNAGIARCSRPAIEAISRMAELMGEGGSTFPEQLRIHEEARGVLAELVGVDKSRLSMFHTCAAAISQVALGMPLPEGAEIVTWDQEYPSNAYPWHLAAKRAKARVVLVESGPDLEVDTQRLIDAIGPKTRVVAISWVQYRTGALTDLRAVSEACRAVGAWLVVDAAQGLGVLPFDLEALGVDVVCGASLKWLTGPPGHGFAAFAEGRRDEIEPLAHGALTYGTPDEHTEPSRAPRRDPRRFEPGEPLLLGAAGTGAAVRLLLDAGIDTVRAEALRLADRIVERVQERGGRVLGQRAGGRRSPITTFVPRGDLHATYAALDRARVSYAPRGGGVRLAPHGYNTDEDVDRALAALEESSSS
jgi:cysteine desulfurase / selenocysteine lyase